MSARNGLICFEQQLNPVDHSSPMGLIGRGESREKQQEAIMESNNNSQVTAASELFRSIQRNRIHDRLLSYGCNFMFSTLRSSFSFLTIHVKRRI